MDQFRAVSESDQYDNKEEDFHPNFTTHSTSGQENVIEIYEGQQLIETDEGINNDVNNDEYRGVCPNETTVSPADSLHLDGFSALALSGEQEDVCNHQKCLAPGKTAKIEISDPLNEKHCQSSCGGTCKCSGITRHHGKPFSSVETIDVSLDIAENKLSIELIEGSDTAEHLTDTDIEMPSLGSFDNNTAVQTGKVNAHICLREESVTCSTEDYAKESLAAESEILKPGILARIDHCVHLDRGHGFVQISHCLLTGTELSITDSTCENGYYDKTVDTGICDATSVEDYESIPPVVMATEMKLADSAGINDDCTNKLAEYDEISAFEEENFETVQNIAPVSEESQGEGVDVLQELSEYNEESVVSDAIHDELWTDGRTAESSLIADMLELKKELVSLTADIEEEGLGLKTLFVGQKKKNEKSKSVRKRKKQQQKLVKSVPTKPPSSSSRFAQCAEELVFAREKEVDGGLTCPVCLELFYMPRSCHPCGHIFCDPCLRRLTTNGWEEVPCPLCRTVIQTCDLQQEFDHIIRGTHPDIYSARAAFEKRSRFRHYRLPLTPPVPLGRRLIRHLRTSARNRQPDSSWMSHDWFKFFLGCTVGVCTSMLIMLLNQVKSINDVRDVNIMFLSLILGASLTVVVFKLFKI